MQRRTQLLLVLLLLWLNVLAQGLVVYVGELVTLHCTAPNNKASWYRTTNSSTGSCQNLLIYEGIVLCDHLSQDSVVQGPFKHRFSVLSSHRGRLVTLVLTQAESSDAGRYVCIDFITKNLILQLDLQVLEKSPTSTLSPFMSRISSDTLSSHMEHVASPIPISAVGNAGDQQKIHISTEKFASDLTLSEFLGKNWITVVLALGMALLMIVVLLMSVYVVHLRRRLKRQRATTDSLHGAFGDLPSEQTPIIRPLNDGQTVIAFSHPISYLPDVLSTQSFQGSYDYPALLDATGSHDRLGVSHVDLRRDHISSCSNSEMSQNDTNSQREFSFDCRRTENPRPDLNALEVITSSCPDRTEPADSTSCIYRSNRPPLQEESQLVRAPSIIRRYDVLDEATVPLRTSDDECDYINIRCSGEYLHQRSCSSDDSSSNFHVSLPGGVHVERPDTTLYANAGELRRVPLHGRNEHKLDTQEQSVLVTSKRQLYPSSLSDLGDILDIIRRAFD